MNKNELIETIAAECDISKLTAGKVLDATIDTISKALARGEQVALMGFGTFAVKPRAEREGRNPGTGEKILIKALNIPVFRAGKALKASVNASTCRTTTRQADSINLYKNTS